jgi:hypothetical protein
VARTAALRSPAALRASLHCRSSRSSAAVSGQRQQRGARRAASAASAAAVAAAAAAGGSIRLASPRRAAAAVAAGSMRRGSWIPGSVGAPALRAVTLPAPRRRCLKDVSGGCVSPPLC